VPFMASLSQACFVLAKLYQLSHGASILLDMAKSVFFFLKRESFTSSTYIFLGYAFEPHQAGRKGRPRMMQSLRSMVQSKRGFRIAGCDSSMQAPSCGRPVWHFCPPNTRMCAASGLDFSWV